MAADLDEKNREEQRRIAEYVASLEGEGHKVYWPKRDTEQNDPTGGYQICLANSRAISEADEVHVWYNEDSGGSKFDIGVAFALDKQVVIANKDYVCRKKKSFYKVLQYMRLLRYLRSSKAD